MAKVFSTISRVRIVGKGWYGQTIAMDKDLTGYDVENIRDREGRGDGKITRKDVALWLTCSSGDFAHVDDFAVTIGDGDLDSDFATEEGECAYSDCMYPSDASDDDL